MVHTRFVHCKLHQGSESQTVSLCINQLHEKLLSTTPTFNLVVSCIPDFFFKYRNQRTQKLQGLKNLSRSDSWITESTSVFDTVEKEIRNILHIKYRKIRKNKNTYKEGIDEMNYVIYIAWNILQPVNKDKGYVYA